MKSHARRLLVGSTLVLLSLGAGAQTPAPGPDMILVRPTDKKPDAVVDAIKAYSEQKKWQYVGDSKVKNGQVTLVKVCIPQVGQILWPLGLQISAMLPCGNIGVYEKQGKTEISMLHPSYMQALYPNAEVQKAVKVATPLLMDMLETVAR
jgi:hypothetical protein